MKITNNSLQSQGLDYSNFILEYGNQQVKPNLEKSLYFKDFAVPYYGDKIASRETKTIGLIYEIDKKEINNKFKLKIYRGVSNKPGQIIAKYNEINLAPILVDELTVANEVELNELLEFNYSNIGNSTFKIDSFQFTKSFQYKYEKCVNESCRFIDDIVSVDYSILGDYRMLLVLNYSFELDNETAYYKSSSTIKDFVNNFMKLRYTIGGETFYSKAIYQTPKNLTDKMVLQVKSNINEADNLDVIFTIRNKNYIINLKKKQ